MILLLRGQVRARTRHLEQANEALRESEMRYQLISTVASDYMFSTRLDAEGKLALNWVAGAFEAITGYTFEEYVAHGGWRAALHPDDLAVDDRDMEKLRANQPVITEIRTLTKSGKTVWVRVYAHPVLDAERKELIGIYGAVQDITERKRAEEILEASERRLSLIFDTVGDVIFLLSVEPEDCFRFASVNPAFLALTGLRHEQVIGKRIEEVLPETAHALAISKYKQAIRENRTVRWEEASAYPTGTLYGAVAVTPARNAAGVCTHLIGSVHDITEIRRAEEQVRKLNAELSQRVAERTEELKIALEKAQEADRLKSAFLATMSHELRTPLNSIIGFTGVLLQELAGPLNDEQDKQLAMIQVSAHHLLALINDVLDISKIEAGQIEIVKQPFDMRLVIEEALRTTSPLAAKKGLSLVAAIAPEVGSMVSDRRRVEQILLNLVNNAIKFTERGEVRVECRIQDGWLDTRVRDTGIGIKPEDMDKLFQPFRQIDTGLTRRHEGTGLGLSICQKLVQLLGGKIGVESEWGKGSTFTFTLPLREDGAMKKILVIEDNEQNLYLATFILEKWLRGRPGARRARGHRAGRPGPSRADPPGYPVAGAGWLRRRAGTAQEPIPSQCAPCGRHLLRHGRRPGTGLGSRLHGLYRETDQPRNIHRRDHTVSMGLERGYAMTTALIVDDHEQNLYLLQTLLEGYGYTVVQARNGSEALELARHNPPNIVISDILMPVMDGFALCREWKKDERLQNIPFVFYTATYTDPKDEDLGLSLGAARFIIKPTEPEAFVVILRQVIQEHATGGLVAPRQPVEEEAVYYRLYNEALVRKLEDKMLELEKVNRALEQDIAERKRAEEALRASEERYRSLFENSDDAILLTAPDGRILAANPAACRIVGRTETEICQTGRAGVVDPTDPRLPIALEERERTGRFRGELTCLRSDGQPFPGEVTSVMFQGEDRQPRTSMIIRDITERKRAEKALEESEARYRNLVEEASIGIVVTVGFTVVFCNQKEIQLFGYKAPSDMQGHAISEFVKQEDLQELAVLGESIGSGKSMESLITFQGIRPDGRELVIEARAIPFSYEGNEALLSFHSDITERKRAEEELARRAEQLELLYDAGLALNSVLDPLAQLEVMFNIAIKTLHADRAEFFRYEAARDELRFELGIGYSEAVQAALRDTRFRMGDERGVVGRVGQNRTPLYQPDVATAPGWVVLDPEIRSGLWVPVEHEGQLRGVLGVLSARADAFTPQDEQLLVLFANQVAIALENARLFEETRRRLDELAVVSHVALIGAAGRPFDETVARATDSLIELWPDVNVSFLFVDEADQSLRLHPSARGVSPEIIASLRIPLNQGITGWVARERQPVRVGDVTADPRYAIAVGVPGAGSEMAAPLVAGERVIGVVNVESPRLNAFSGDDLRLLTTLAGQLATIFEKARLDAALEEERALLARRVEERTAELNIANAELRQAARAKDEFLASMSHELRTPLNAILGISEALQEQVFGPLNEKQLRYRAHHRGEWPALACAHQ